MMFFSSIGVRGGVVHLCLVFFTFCNSSYLVKFVLLFVHVAFTFCSRTISCSFACAVQWWAVVKRHRIAVGQQVAGDSAPEISLAYFFTHFTFCWLDSKCYQTGSPHFEVREIFTSCLALLFACINSSIGGQFDFLWEIILNHKLRISYQKYVREIILRKNKEQVV